MSDQWTIRAYHPDDVQAIVDIYHAIDDAIGVERTMTPLIVQTMIEYSQNNPAQDTLIAEIDGRVIGFAAYNLMLAAGTAWARGVVHPDFWGRGIGTQFVQLTDARIADRVAAELPADVPMMIDRYINQENGRAVRLLEAQGYRYIRTAYEMQIILDQPIDAPILTAPLQLRAFTPEQAHAVHDAYIEAFADNRDRVEMSFEEWAQMMLNAADVDTSLWQLAYDGDQLAGFALNRLDDPQGKRMYIGIVGVRRPWRRQGLGEALLRHSFAAFRERGTERVSLHVDSSNKTNALGLYERAGMHIHSRVLLYRKMLRGEAPEEA